MSYDNDSPNWVYFDDFKVTHTTTNVIQYNEYYPFGLRTENSWTREDHSNKFLYNAGSELNANSGWYETFFRGYDAALGRFMQVDPLASVSSSYSSYNYAYNNPVLFNDPLGDRPEEVMRDLELSGGGSNSYQMYDDSYNWTQGLGNNQYGQHRISGSQYYGGMMSATAFYQKAMCGHGGYWENGMATMYQYDREAEKYFDFEQYTHAIDHGEGWYGADNGINVNRYEWIVGIKSTKKGQQGEQCQNCGWNFQLGVEAEATLGWVNFGAEVKHGIGGTFRHNARVIGSIKSNKVDGGETYYTGKDKLTRKVSEYSGSYYVGVNYKRTYDVNQNGLIINEINQYNIGALGILGITYTTDGKGIPQNVFLGLDGGFNAALFLGGNFNVKIGAQYVFEK